jgi:hypothetical protein
MWNADAWCTCAATRTAEGLHPVYLITAHILMMEGEKKETCRISVRVNKQQVGADFFLSVARWRGTEPNELGMLESKWHDWRCKQKYVTSGRTTTRRYTNMFRGWI